MGRPDWEPLVVTFKRTINILPDRPRAPVDPARFVHEAERSPAHGHARRRSPGASRARGGDYRGALTELAGLRPDVDRFFEAVLVMDKDPVVQDNRLALLRALADLLLAIADLRRIVPAAGAARVGGRRRRQAAVAAVAGPAGPMAVGRGDPPWEAPGAPERGE